MSNPIKYSTGSESLALKSGNFYIGTGDVSKGPTDNSGFWNGLNPPASGYTIYLNKESGGPSVYSASNDEELITLTNIISGQNLNTAQECLVYYASQTDKIVVNRFYPPIVTDSLVLNMDAGFTPSYPTSGTTWYNLSGSNTPGSLNNGVSFTQSSGSLSFDGTDDEVYVTNYDSINMSGSQQYTAMAIIYPLLSGTTWHGVFSKGNSQQYALTINSPSAYFHYESNQGGVSALNSAAGSVTVNNWQHVAVRFDGTNKTIWKNGQILVTQAASTLNSTSNTEPFRIGEGNNGEQFRGEIRSVQVYRKSLSTAEIQQNYYQGLLQTSSLSYIVDPANLVSNGTSTTITDLTSSKYVFNYEGTTELVQDFGGTLRLNTGRIYRSVVSWYGNYTFGFWVKMVGGTQSGNFYTESNRGPSGCARVYSVMNSNGTFTYQVWDNSSINTLGTGQRQVTTTTNVQNGDWYFITCVWSNGSSNRTRGLYVFVNGILESSVDMVGNDGAYSSFHLGGAFGCLGLAAFNCYIGPFMQYGNLAMNNTQVFDLYNTYQDRYR